MLQRRHTSAGDSEMFQSVAMASQPSTISIISGELPVHGNESAPKTGMEGAFDDAGGGGSWKNKIPARMRDGNMFFSFVIVAVLVVVVVIASAMQLMTIRVVDDSEVEPIQGEFIADTARRTPDWHPRRVFYNLTDAEIADQAVKRRFPSDLQNLVMLTADDLVRKNLWCNAPAPARQPVANVISYLDPDTGEPATIFNAGISQLEGARSMYFLMDAQSDTGATVLLSSGVTISHSGGILRATGPLATCLQIALLEKGPKTQE